MSPKIVGLSFYGDLFVAREQITTRKVKIFQKSGKSTLILGESNPVCYMSSCILFSVHLRVRVSNKKVKGTLEEVYL